MVFIKDGLAYPENQTECVDTKCDNCGHEYFSIIKYRELWPTGGPVQSMGLRCCVLVEAV